MMGPVFGNFKMTQNFKRFLMVGAFNTVVTYLAYVALTMVVHYKIAFTISFVLGILISARLNARFSFQTQLTKVRLLKYSGVYVASYLFSIYLLGLIVEKTQINLLVAPLLIVIVVTPLNYFLTKLTLQYKQG